MPARPSYTLELAGLAGAGKSTLSGALADTGARYEADRPSPRTASELPVFLRSGVRLLPTLVRPPWTGRRYRWDDVSRMVYLTAMPRALRRPTSAAPIVLDHGPTFQLAHLRAFGPPRLSSPRHDAWWRRQFRQWGRRLDLLVWLTAPEATLVDRIRSRSQAHAVKEASDQEARAYLDRYRDGYAYALAGFERESSLRILKLSTDDNSTETLAELVTAEIDRGPARRADLHQVGSTRQP